MANLVTLDLYNKISKFLDIELSSNNSLGIKPKSSRKWKSFSNLFFKEGYGFSDSYIEARAYIEYFMNIETYHQKFTFDDFGRINDVIRYILDKNNID